MNELYFWGITRIVEYLSQLISSPMPLSLPLLSAMCMSIIIKLSTFLHSCHLDLLQTRPWLYERCITPTKGYISIYGLKGDFDWAFNDNLTKFQLLETFTLRFLVNLHFSHCWEYNTSRKWNYLGVWDSYTLSLYGE